MEPSQAVMPGRFFCVVEWEFTLPTFDVDSHIGIEQGYGIKR